MDYILWLTLVLVQEGSNGHYNELNFYNRLLIWDHDNPWKFLALESVQPIGALETVADKNLTDGHAITLLWIKLAKTWRTIAIDRTNHGAKMLMFASMLVQPTKLVSRCFTPFTIINGVHPKTPRCSTATFCASRHFGQSSQSLWKPGGKTGDWFRTKTWMWGLLGPW